MHGMIPSIIVSTGIIVAAASILPLTFYAGSRFYEWKHANAQNILVDKVGFRASSNLKDGREVDYWIDDDFDYGAEERVSIYGPEHVFERSTLVDKNNDKLVDEVVIDSNNGLSRTVITRNSHGKISYDSSVLDDSQAREIMASSDILYAEAIQILDVDKKIKDYSTRIVGNPLEYKVSQLEASK